MAIIGTNIEEAANYLRQDELVGMPTETVYGLAGNAFSEAAVLKIFETKRRPSFDPLIVHVADLDGAAKVARYIPRPARRLAEAFWPGPLTLLLPKTDKIPDLVTAGLTHVGVRMPRHPLTIKLIRQLDFPLAAPSANPFGYISPTEAQHVEDQLGNQIPYILDGGPATIGLESTVIGFEDETAVVYRMGGLTLEQLRQYVRDIKVQAHSTSNPASPGQLASHYAPAKGLLLGTIEDLLPGYNNEEVAILSFKDTYTVPHQFILSPAGDISEAAQNLFKALRKLDNSPAKIILAEFVPDYGLGRAINDRLRRAAVPASENFS